MNKPMPMILAALVHLTGAVVGFLASTMYFMAGLDYQGSFYAMVTCVWIFTLGMRIIERVKRSPVNKRIDELRRRP